MSHSPAPEYSRSVEDFLKTVFTLEQDSGRVSTNALAEALGVKAPSVTDMARRMVEAKLVHYERYRGVTLTDAGRAIALNIIRRHRLIELYLVEELGYDLHEVHNEAENLEHAVSDRFIHAIAAKLGNPQLDPHGDPIPSADGVMIARKLVPLTELPLDTPAVVAQLNADSSDMLQHILERDFRLRTQVQVTQRDPFDGPLTIRVDGSERILGHNAAACILVDAERNEH
jgi:DtxR family Mn-dependent transcriptional regulator